MHSGTRPHALRIGLLLSVVLHGLLVVWNPVVHRSPDARRQTPQSRAVEWRTVVVNPARNAAATTSRAAEFAADASSTDAAEAATSPDDDERQRAAPAARAPTTSASVAERLGYRSSTLWAPLDSTWETLEQCRQREYAERLDSLVRRPADAGEPVPRSATEPRPRGFGISIPLGGKPPPRAQVVAPPPTPDSLRRANEPTIVTARVIRRPPGCADPLVPDSLRR